MGCVSCSTGSCGSKNKTKSGVSGCKNNGTCGTGGCNKMNVFDWLSNMDVPQAERFQVTEIRFKNGRKEFYRNADNLELFTGDTVVVEITSGGFDMGVVSLQGELVRLQMLKKKIADDDTIRKVIRRTTEQDDKKWEQAQARELPVMYRTREIIRELGISMKLSDVEFQADNTKATFYYSADDRVDFRELIKVLAAEFKIRVEMKQISLRQEAGRLGGIGSCGRELCCSTWLSDFKSVATSAARYQNLSLNPTKLSGQCGRLKCCLNYELETYVDALQDIPAVEKPLLTKKGDARLNKTDIFKKIMWFSYSTDETTWHPVPASRVLEILEMNAAGKLPETLFENELAIKPKQNTPLIKLKEKDKPKQYSGKQPYDARKPQNPSQQGNNTQQNKTTENEADKGQFRPKKKKNKKKFPPKNNT